MFEDLVVYHGGFLLSAYLYDCCRWLLFLCLFDSAFLDCFILFDGQIILSVLLLLVQMSTELLIVTECQCCFRPPKCLLYSFKAQPSIDCSTGYKCIVQILSTLRLIDIVFSFIYKFFKVFSFLACLFHWQSVCCSCSFPLPFSSFLLSTPSCPLSPSSCLIGENKKQSFPRWTLLEN